MYREACSRPLPLVALFVTACGHDHGPPHVRNRCRRPTAARRCAAVATRGRRGSRTTRSTPTSTPTRHQITAHRDPDLDEHRREPGRHAAVPPLPQRVQERAVAVHAELARRDARRHGERHRLGLDPTSTRCMIGGVEQVGEAQDSVAPPDETVAELPLAAPVAPGQTIEINFKFTAQLPEVFARTGYKGEFHMVGQWFPKIGVRVGPPGARAAGSAAAHGEHRVLRRLRHLRRHAHRAEHVHGRGDRRARRTRSESPGGTRTFTYHAEDVHDFAWMADPFMNDAHAGRHRRRRAAVDVTRVLPPRADATSRCATSRPAIGAIEKFSTYFMPYPWSMMTIIDPPIDAAAGAGGMEYPTLVTTAGDSVFARPGMQLPEYVTVHEVGHNWFQGMLASNEAEEAWLDEGVNEWADAHVMADLYGAADLGRRLDRLSGRDRRRCATRSSTTRPRCRRRSRPPRTRSSTPRLTASTTYDYTMRALLTLEHDGRQREVPGRDEGVRARVRVQASDRRATSSRRCRTSSIRISAGSSARCSSRSAGARFAIRSSRMPPGPRHSRRRRRRLRRERPGPRPRRRIPATWVCEVVVQNTGVVHVPVDVELRFADDSTQRLHWDDKRRRHVATVHRRALDEAGVGPDRSRQQDRCSTRRSATRTGSRAKVPRRCAPARGSGRGRRP